MGQMVASVRRLMTQALGRTRQFMQQMIGYLQANPVGKVIVRVTGFILGTNMITSLLGFAYWLVATHYFSPRQVGLGSAAISAMLLLGSVSLLGVGTTLVREMPRQPQHTSVLIVTGLATVGGAGVICGLLGALLLPLLSHDLRGITDSIPTALLFTVGVSLTAIALLVDQIYIGLLRGFLQFTRNAIFSVAKLGLLVALGVLALGNAGNAILSSWILGTVISLLAIAGASLSMRYLTRWQRPRWDIAKGLARTALGFHLLNMEMVVPGLAMPVVVAAVLSAENTAYFYSASNIASFILYIPYALAITLFAVGASSAEDIAAKARFTLQIALLAGVLTNIALFIGAGPVLSVFGKVYAEQSAWCLRILGLGVFPLIIKDQFIAVCRVHGKVSGVVRGLAVGTVMEIALAAIGGVIGGLVGVSLGWDLALCGEAVFMFPALYRVLTRQDVPTPSQSLVSVVAHPIQPDSLFGELETLPHQRITREMLRAYTADELSLSETIPYLAAIPREAVPQVAGERKDEEER